MKIYTTIKTMTAAQYAYDALGRRIEARSFADGQVDAVRRYWYNDQWQVLTQGLWSQAYMGLSLSRNYIYGNYIDEVLGFEWVVNGTPSIWYYYLHDHLYSPAAMLTEYGVVERYEYDAYGRRSVMTPGFAHRSNSHYLSDIGLTGREIDELDLDAAATPRLQHMHYRHRDYSPQLGRFMQHDPLGVNPAGGDINHYLPIVQYDESQNAYEYVTSKPILKADPYGLNSVILKSAETTKPWERTRFPWGNKFDLLTCSQYCNFRYYVGKFDPTPDWKDILGEVMDSTMKKLWKKLCWLNSLRPLNTCLADCKLKDIMMTPQQKVDPKAPYPGTADPWPN